METQEADFFYTQGPMWIKNIFTVGVMRAARNAIFAKCLGLIIFRANHPLELHTHLG